ncbi:MAG: hypothetical protein HWN69_00100 [Desulfobacterales bacterium]|nr:hypothetical protein [Desulfobacterales bacterium]
MASAVDIKVALGQGNLVKKVQNVKHQTFRRKKFPAVRDQKEEKKKEKEALAEEFADSDKGRVRDDGTKADSESEEQLQDSGNKKKKKKVRGGLVDVVI